MFSSASAISLSRSASTTTYNTSLEEGKECFPLGDVEQSVQAIVKSLGSQGFINLISNLYGGIKVYSLLQLRDHSKRSFIHKMVPGGFLGSHIDQTRLETSGFGRDFIHMASAVYYLSPHWEPSWGGHTTIFGADGTSDAVAIPYTPNTVCLFYHDSYSWHGVSRIDKLAKIPRHSIYMDYYIHIKDLPRLRAFVFGLRGRHPSFRDHSVTFINQKGEQPYTDIWNIFLKSQEI